MPKANKNFIKTRKKNKKIPHSPLMYNSACEIRAAQSQRLSEKTSSENAEQHTVEENRKEVRSAPLLHRETRTYVLTVF